MLCAAVLGEGFRLILVGAVGQVVVHIPSTFWMEREVDQHGVAVNPVVHQTSSESGCMGKMDLCLGTERLENRCTEQSIHV